MTRLLFCFMAETTPTLTADPAFWSVIVMVGLAILGTAANWGAMRSQNRHQDGKISRLFQKTDALENERMEFIRERELEARLSQFKEAILPELENRVRNQIAASNRELQQVFRQMLADQSRADGRVLEAKLNSLEAKMETLKRSQEKET